MNISGYSSVSLYNPASLKNRHEGNQLYSPLHQSLNNTSPDVVTISERGKALSNQEVPEELLKMAMAPGWYQDFLPISSKIGTPESYQVGHLARMEAYQEKYKNELAEYGKIFHESFSKAKVELGINDQNDMYEKVIKNPEFSEVLRQTVEQKIKESPKGWS